jgi:hypothetical protein
MSTMPEQPTTTEPAWHAGFLALLPAIYDQLRFNFRGLPPEARDDAIAECLASAAVAFQKLHEQDRADLAYPTVLAKFAVRQFRSGRRVGGQLNRNDVLSTHGQRHHGLTVERLDRRYPDGAWKEVLVEDRRSTPAATAIARIDFGDWLSRLCRRERGVATTLASGESGRGTAKKFGLTAGRISQLRGELKRNWERFQGEVSDDAGELALAAC